jgi:hypothetical protein
LNTVPSSSSFLRNIPQRGYTTREKRYKSTKYNHNAQMRETELGQRPSK